MRVEFYGCVADDILRNCSSILQFNSRELRPIRIIKLLSYWTCLQLCRDFGEIYFWIESWWNICHQTLCSKLSRSKYWIQVIWRWCLFWWFSSLYGCNTCWCYWRRIWRWCCYCQTRIGSINSRTWFMKVKLKFDRISVENRNSAKKSKFHQNSWSTQNKLAKKNISQHTKMVLVHKRKMTDLSFPTRFQILFSTVQKAQKNLVISAIHFMRHPCHGKKQKMNVSNKDLIWHQFITKMSKHLLKVFSSKVHKMMIICGLEWKILDQMDISYGPMILQYNTQTGIQVNPITEWATIRKKFKNKSIISYSKICLTVRTMDDRTAGTNWSGPWSGFLSEILFGLVRGPDFHLVQ